MTSPFSVLLSDPLYTVVILDDPAILWDVVWYFDNLELGMLSCSLLQAQLLDYLDKDWVISSDILVGTPVFIFGDVFGELFVHGYGLWRQAEAPVACIYYNLAWHLVVWVS